MVVMALGAYPPLLHPQDPFPLALHWVMAMVVVVVVAQ